MQSDSEAVASKKFLKGVDQVTARSSSGTGSTAGSATKQNFAVIWGSRKSLQVFLAQVCVPVLPSPLNTRCAIGSFKTDLVTVCKVAI